MGLLMFDSITGKLVNSLMSMADEYFHGRLTSFELGPRKRKFFLSDQMGVVKVFNYRSGEHINSLVRSKQLRKREELDSEKGLKKSYEITKVIFCEEQRLAITVSCDSVIRLYEITNQKNNALREIVGGHGETEITAAAYCPQTLTIYTGAANGTLAVWALDYSRLGCLLKESSSEISCIADLFPYPCILAGDSRGVVVAWRTRDISSLSPNPKHQTMNPADLLLFRVYCAPPAPEVSRLRESSLQAVCSVVTLDSFQDAVPDHQKRYHRTQVSEQLARCQSFAQRHSYQFVSFEDTLELVHPVYQMSPKELCDATLEKKKSLKTAFIETVNTINQQTFSISNIQDSISSVINSQKERKRKPVSTKYAVVGTINGELSVFDVDLLMASVGLPKLNQKEYHRSRFEKFRPYLIRKDTLNAEKLYQQYMKEFSAAQAEPATPKPVYLSSLLCCRRWDSRHKHLNSLGNVPEPAEGFVTCGRDNFVRVWSIYGEVWGEMNVNSLDRTVWRLPFDFLSPILDELREVVEILRKLGKIDHSKQTEEKVIAKYLFENYLKPELLIHQEKRENRLGKVVKKEEDLKLQQLLNLCQYRLHNEESRTPKSERC